MGKLKYRMERNKKLKIGKDESKPQPKPSTKKQTRPANMQRSLKQQNDQLIVALAQAHQCIAELEALIKKADRPTFVPIHAFDPLHEILLRRA